MGKRASIWDLMLAAAVLGHDGTFRRSSPTKDAKNPHNFSRFETDGFVSYSINQASHDAKYKKYLKRKSST